jgi:hypothetical protein
MGSYLYFLTFPTTATGSSGKGVRPFAKFVPLWLRAATVIGPTSPRISAARRSTGSAARYWATVEAVMLATMPATVRGRELYGGRLSAANGAHGTRDIEGKMTRVGASECGQRTSFNQPREVGDSVWETEHVWRTSLMKRTDRIY